MGYFLTNIVVYGILFALAVMGYNAIREMRTTRKNSRSFAAFSHSKGSAYFCKKARKMKSTKKPDGVAWNEETQEYISKLLPYATSKQPRHSHSKRRCL